MRVKGIEFDVDRIGAMARAAGVVRLYLFGSILTDRFGPASDVDILAETDPRDPPGLMALGGLQMDLTELLGRNVHLSLLGGIPVSERAGLVGGASLLMAA